MKILVVGIVKNQQISRLREEAEKKGHQLDACFSSDISINCDMNKFEPLVRGKSLTEYNLIYLLTLGVRRWVWYAACEYLKDKGVVIVNSSVVDPTYNFNINVAKEYLMESLNNIPYPKSMIILSSRFVDMVLDNFKFPFILKSGEGRQGKFVFKIENREELIACVSKMEKDKLTIVVREFIPNDGDIRVFVLGYKAIGAMKRTPKKGDFRSNISQGGKGISFDINRYPNIKYISEYVAKVNRTEIAGVDIVVNKKNGKPYVLEVNPGPQFEGLEKYTGINVGEKIINYFENLVV